MKGDDFTMKQDLGLCFKLEREKAGYTQEEAAELLDVSITTIGNYERNIVKKPDENLVVEMMELYESKWLGYVVIQGSKIGQLVLPEINMCKPSNGVLSFQSENRDIDEIRNDLIDIAIDDEIKAEEIPRWKNAVKEIKEACASGLALTLMNYQEVNMSVEKVLFLYEKFGLTIAKDGDSKTFVTDIEKKKAAV